jgi:transcriptional regulator with XRE-family HTH domain
MVIGGKLRQLREAEGLSQGDIEKRTGLLRCYISRAENGHTVPAIETLEKRARAMEIELYQLFFEANGQKQPQELKPPKAANSKLTGEDSVVVRRLSKLVSRMDDRDTKLLVGFAQKLAAKT